MDNEETTIEQRIEAAKARLTVLIDKDDPAVAELLERLAGQIAIAEHAQATIQREGITIETRSTIKAHPAINICHNATLAAIRLINKMQIGDPDDLIEELDLS